MKYPKIAGFVRVPKTHLCKAGDVIVRTHEYGEPIDPEIVVNVGAWAVGLTARKAAPSQYQIYRRIPGYVEVYKPNRIPLNKYFSKALPLP
jgi:hypothetical protein